MKISSQYGNRGQKTALAAAVSSVLLASPAVMAQDKDSSDPAVLDEIVVSEKFQQSLIDRIPISREELPFSLDVIGRDLLDMLNFGRPIDALTTLPNVAIITDRQGTGTPEFLARGFEAPLLVDNRQQNAFRGAGARDDSFVERYEVLRGPASITLGPVGSGGVFNTVTKSPQAEQFFDSKLRLDAFGSVGVELDYNAGSLGDSGVVSGRISGAYRDWQFDADPTERQTMAIRPVFVFDFTSQTSARISAAYTQHDVKPNKGFPLYSDGSVPDEFDTSTFTGFWNGEGEVNDTLADLEVVHEFLDNLKLTVRGSYQTTDFDYENTAAMYNYLYDDGGQGIGLNNPVVYLYNYAGITESENKFFDAQLATHWDWGGRRQDLVVAASWSDDYFYRQFTSYDYIAVELEDVDVPRYATDRDDFGPSVLFEGELVSVLSEVAIRPADWATLVLGVRYDDVDQTNVRWRGPTPFESGVVDDATTFRAGFTFHMTDSLNSYISYAESFLPQFGTDRDGNPVSPEESEGAEIGIKGTVLDDNLLFTAAIFRTDRQDVTVSRFDPSDGGVYTETIGEVRAEGFEFTSDWQLTDGFSMTLNYGFTDTDIVEAGDFEEITATAFPEHTGSLYLTYRLQGGTTDGLWFSAGARFNGERESGVAPGITFDSYTVADVKVAYGFRNGMQLSLDVLNVTDELYLESTGGLTGRLTGSSNFGPPLTAVVTLSSRF